MGSVHRLTIRLMFTANIIEFLFRFNKNIRKVELVVTCLGHLLATASRRAQHGRLHTCRAGCTLDRSDLVSSAEVA